jgi:hypothetical protein
MHACVHMKIHIMTFIYKFYEHANLRALISINPVNPTLNSLNRINIIFLKKKRDVKLINSVTQYFFHTSYLC